MTDIPESLPSYVVEKVWRRAYRDPSLVDYKPPEKPTYTFIYDAEKAWRDEQALFFYGRGLSYEEIIGEAESLAAGFEEEGLGKSDRVALFLPNSPQFLIAYLAAHLLGAVIVPLNPLYTPSELSAIIDDSKPKAVVALDALIDKLVEALKLSKHSPSLIVSTSIGDYMPLGVRLIARLLGKLPAPPKALPKKAKSFRRIMRRGWAPSKPSINPHEDLAVIAYTGGTTGTPKGVMLTHYNVSSNIMQTRMWLFKPAGPLGEGEATVIVLPVFHAFGQIQLIATISNAMKVYLLPRFNPKETLKTIKSSKASLFAGVPLIYRVLLEEAGAGAKSMLGGLKIAIVSADVVPDELRRRFEEQTGALMIEGYGLTEASPVVSINTPYPDLRRPGSVGPPLPGTLVMIVDPVSLEPLEPGSPGELLVSGPQVMRGYLGKPLETKQTLVEIGGLRWLRTGDIMRIDEDGYLYFVERAKFMIKYKGYSVYPKEIEDVMYKHPCIEEAAVVGIPDPRVGEKPVAAIVLKEGCTASKEELISFLRSSLAPYKVPKDIVFLEELPKTPIGKILRRELRKIVAEKLGGEARRA